MYKEYNISLIYRFIGLLLFLLTIAFIENVYVLIVLFVGIFVVNKKINPLLLFMTFITLFFIVLKMMNSSILIANMMLMIDYIIIFVINTKKEEYIVAKNIILNKKFTYKQLEKIYINDISENNKDNFEKIIVNKKEDSNISLIEIAETKLSTDITAISVNLILFLNIFFTSLKFCLYIRCVCI